TVPAGALEPHESFPETVPSKLTDGVRLPEGRTHNSGREYLLAFVKPGARGVEASIIYDLDDVRTIKQVRISAYSWRTSAYTYYYPDLIQVFVSSDGVRWRQVVNYPNPIPRAQQENPGEN